MFGGNAASHVLVRKSTRVKTGESTEASLDGFINGAQRLHAEASLIRKNERKGAFMIA